MSEAILSKIRALLSERESWGVVYSIGEYMVIAGVAGELLDLFPPFVRKFRRWRRWVAALSIVVLIAGLLIEKHAGDKREELSDAHIALLTREAARLTRETGHLNRKTARLNKEAAGAAERTANLEREAAALRKEAADAAERTATLEKENLALREELDERTRPRTFDTLKFVEALKGKPTGAVEIVYEPNDPEAYNLAEEIEGAFVHGPGLAGPLAEGWKFLGRGPLPGKHKWKPEAIPGVQPDAPLSMRFGAWWGRNGIGYMTGVDSEGDAGPAVAAIADALEAVGYSPASAIAESMPRDTVVIVVAKR